MQSSGLRVRKRGTPVGLHPGAPQLSPGVGSPFSEGSFWSGWAGTTWVQVVRVSCVSGAGTPFNDQSSGQGEPSHATVTPHLHAGTWGLALCPEACLHDAAWPHVVLSHNLLLPGTGSPS